MIGFKETAKVVLLAAGLILSNAAQAAGTVSPECTGKNLPRVESKNLTQIYQGRKMQ